MRRLCSAVRYVSSVMTLPPSHGGGVPPPTPSPMATRPPPELPPKSSGRIFKPHICATRTFAHPPSTATTSSSSTTSDLHLPRLHHSSSNCCTLPESPSPSGYVFPLFPQNQGLRSVIPCLCYHPLFSDPLSPIDDCGAAVNNHGLWADKGDMSASTSFVRPYKVLAKGFVQFEPIYRALSVIMSDPDGVAAAELKEERSPFRGLLYALLFGCLKWKLSLAEEVGLEQYLNWGTYLRFKFSGYISNAPSARLELSLMILRIRLAFDQKVNSYPIIRGFTAIGSRGEDFVQAMVVAVESVIQQLIPH